MKELIEKEFLPIGEMGPEKLEGKKPEAKKEPGLKDDKPKKMKGVEHKQNSIEEKVHFLIDICTDREELLKIRKILIEFGNVDLEPPERKEMREHEERRIKRR